MKEVKGAPSRSARKLEEAFGVLGRSPTKGESAVDLGAAPGGWSLCLAKRGANVTAVDHASLDLKGVGKLPGTITHLEENGLKFLPPAPVDWLCCDMVLPARETLNVLKRWLDANLMHAFVVNVKLPRQKSWGQVSATLEFLEPYRSKWKTLRVRHLYHDRHEITLMGSKRL
jgi:23S rRNA (cytidine2498-2'-O)-methyltransferase